MQIVFIVTVVALAIMLIVSAAGQGVGVSRSTMEEELAITGKKAEELKQDATELEASRLLGEARYFDQSNPYEDKEEVAAKYRIVFEKYPNTRAAQEARIKVEEVMQRRK